MTTVGSAWTSSLTDEPKNVSEASVDTREGNHTVRVEWGPPLDEEMQPLEVVLYRVQWGPVRTGAVQQFIDLEGEQNVTEMSSRNRVRSAAFSNPETNLGVTYQNVLA